MNCPTCATPIEGHGNKRYCSARCRRLAHIERKAHPCVDCGTTLRGDKPEVKRCWPCWSKHVRHIATARRTEMIALRAAGLGNEEIAAKVGAANANVVAHALCMAKTENGMDVPTSPYWLRNAA